MSGVLSCTESFACPCYALPVAGCFAQPCDWHFSIRNGHNAKRSMERHIAAHYDHADDAAVLIKKAQNLTLLEQGYRCNSCGLNIVGSRCLSMAVEHTCAAPSTILPSTRRRFVKSVVATQKRKLKIALARACRQDKKTPFQLHSTKRRVITKTKATPAVFQLPRDLEYRKLARTIDHNRASLDTLTRVQLGSLRNWSKLEPTTATFENSLAIKRGDYVCTPKLERYFYITDKLDTETVKVLEFEKCGDVGPACSVHGIEDVPCWRLSNRLVEKTLKLNSCVQLASPLIPKQGAQKHEGVIRIWQRCFQVAQPSSVSNGQLSQATDVWLTMDQITRDAYEVLMESGDDEAEDVLSPSVLDIFTAVTTVRIHYGATGSETLPQTCRPVDSVYPHSGGSLATPCHIKKYGLQGGPNIISAGGFRKSVVQRYYCTAHGLECVDLVDSFCSTGSLSVQGDRVSRDYIISGDYWPRALRLFAETENWEALKRDLEGTTSDGCREKLRCELRSAQTLTTFEKGLLHSALMGFCRRVPDSTTIAKWFIQYISAVARPLSFPVSRQILRTHGAVLAFDFSTCDCRSLVARTPESTAKAPRTLGGITCLFDVAPLPPLYTNLEERRTKELLLGPCLTIMAVDGTRPMGIITDSLGKDFPMLISVLEATQPPGTFVHVKLQNTPVEQIEALVRDGHIVVDSSEHKVFGIELGEDGLHVYKRLVESVSLGSREAAWTIRCLRKAFGSWNPLTRSGCRDVEHEDEKDELFYTSLLARSVAQADTSSVFEHILKDYFAGQQLGTEAYACLVERCNNVWLHPQTNLVLPPCAKVVILDDAAHWSGIFGGVRRQAVASAYMVVYKDFPTVDSIRQDLELLQALVAKCCFSRAPRGPSVKWHKAQIEYLRKVRRRPGLARQEQDSQPGIATVGLQAVAAGQGKFKTQVALQCRKVIVNGLLASFRISAWVHAQNWRISLGTVGIERFWRAWQRLIKNRSRSHASLDTISAIIFQRWYRNLHAQLNAADTILRSGNVAFEAQHMLTSEQFAATLLGDDQLELAPLTAAGGKGFTCKAEEELMEIYDACKRGRVLE